MKSLKLFIYIFILITTFSVFGFSQTNISRIATIDTEKFSDKQNGIKEFAEDVEKLETDFKTQTDEYNSKTEKSRQLYKKINDFYVRNHHSKVGREVNQILTF